MAEIGPKFEFGILGPTSPRLKGFFGLDTSISASKTTYWPEFSRFPSKCTADRALPDLSSKKCLLHEGDWGPVSEISYRYLKWKELMQQGVLGASSFLSCPSCQKTMHTSAHFSGQDLQDEQDQRAA